MGLFKRFEQQGDLMGKMMDTVGVDLSKAEPTVLESEMRNAIFNCGFCRSVEECKVWLEAPQGEDAPESCPNAERFARWKRNA